MMRTVLGIAMVLATGLAGPPAGAQQNASIPPAAISPAPPQSHEHEAARDAERRALETRVVEERARAEAAAGHEKHSDPRIREIRETDDLAGQRAAAQALADQHADERECSAIQRHAGLFRAFEQGDLNARECALRRIQLNLAGSSEYSTARENVRLLETFYVRRAQRQQAFMDTWSLVTFVGAAGALSGNMSTHTQQSWATVAFAPSVISQFNAYEPTRELYHAGSIGLQLITLRNDRINESIRLLTPPTSSAPPSPFGTVSCKDATDLVARVQKKRSDHPSTYDTESVLLAEVRRLSAACSSLSARQQAIDFTVDYAKLVQTNMVREYANNVISLDRALLARDRDLRYTPLETLAAIVSSPLRAADFVITGDDTKTAVDSLKTQVALTGLDMSLAPIILPSLDPKAAVPAVAPLSAAAAALKAGPADGLPDELAQAAEIATNLGGLQQRQSFRERLATDLIVAAAADQLTFSYDAITRVTTVKLAAKPAPTTLATGSTSTPLP
jgi:hypothetical protein